MTIIEKIKSFLNEAEDISIGYNELNFISADNFDSEQVGYSIDDKGNSLITGQPGDWQEGWVVVGNDNLGDPIFIDTSDCTLAVFTSPHGEGEWNTILIANSIDNFKAILRSLKIFSKGRQSPVELESNPIAKEEKLDFFETVKSYSSDLDTWWWETFLEDETE